mgnify:CR=1 FL=1
MPFLHTLIKYAADRGGLAGRVADVGLRAMKKRCVAVLTAALCLMLVLGLQACAGSGGGRPIQDPQAGTVLPEGAKKEDIAASIFQSVVTQTISGLACGRPIRGHVAFLGGPLQYLPELRKRFYETLELDDEHIIVPDNAHLFVASGCALAGSEAKAELLSDVVERLENLGDVQGSEVVRLPPLFKDEAD